MKFVALLLAMLTIGVAGAPPDADQAKLIGQPAAPISIEVFSSFACSHCKDFHERILPQLMKDYVSTGKVCIVPRETFPPNFPAALEAATTATAAARIGKYHEVSDALFRTQAMWAQTGKVWDAAASVLSADQQKKVQALARDSAIAGEVRHDLELAQQENVTTTPTLIVRTSTRKYPLPGVPEYALLRGLLDTLATAK